MREDLVKESIKLWVEKVVVGLNLCPFAKAELIRNRIRFQVSSATTEDQLLADLQVELERLEDRVEIETTLLIHPQVLTEFLRYNNFLSRAEELITSMDLEGIYQIASFHPLYQFAGTNIDVAENYTNRSPYPMLHLLREQSVAKAVANYADIENVSVRNIELLSAIGTTKLQQLLLSCYLENES